jgi:hypothetical protein
MRLLMPIGVLLIVVGTAGWATSCYDVSLFNSSQTDTTAARLEDQTDKASDQANNGSSKMVVAPFAGLAVAIGLVCVAIGMGRWRRPVPSDVRPANPWNDQPGEHGEPPRGLV